MQFSIDKFLNRALVVAGIVLAIAVAALGHAQLPPPQYRVGDDLREIPELWLWPDEVRTTTVLLWINTHCGASLDSLPFYAELATLPRRRSRLVVVGRQPLSELRAVLRSASINPDDVISVGTRPLRLPYTPTLLVIDQRGAILESRVGRLLSTSDQDALKTYLD